MERICSKYFWNTQKASDIIGVDEHRAEYLMLKIMKLNISFIITCIISYIMMLGSKAPYSTLKSSYVL